MKKCIAIMMSVLMVIQTVPVFANHITTNGVTANARSISVKDLDVTSSENGFDISGKIPVVSGLADLSFQKMLNDKIVSFKQQKINTAKKDGAREIDFTYETKTDKDIVSILIFTTATTASASDEADSFNFDQNTCKMIDITNVLGVNAIALVDRYLSETIKQNPDQFSSEFKGVNTALDFAVEDGSCIIYFDKYEIAPGYRGKLKFSLKISDVHHVVLSKKEYDILRNDYNLKMIPLRAVCEGLSYAVAWDEISQGIVISKGNFSTKVDVGKNSYFIGISPPRELEAPPALKDGKTYLPISFFEVILGATYTLDEKDKIVFSQYRLK